jgi:hypothetical protein
MSEGIINLFFYITYALLVLALLGLLVGVFREIFQNFKGGGKSAVIGLVGLFILFGIGYAVSPSELTPSLITRGFGVADLGTFKLSSAGIITFYFLAIIAVIFVVIDIVKGIFQ